MVASSMWWSCCLQYEYWSNQWLFINKCRNKSCLSSSDFTFDSCSASIYVAGFDQSMTMIMNGVANGIIRISENRSITFAEWASIFSDNLEIDSVAHTEEINVQQNISTPTALILFAFYKQHTIISQMSLSQLKAK